MAGENRSPQNTIGDGGMALHNWMFVQKAFWQHLGKDGGTEDGPDGIRDAIARTGANIMGKRMFSRFPDNSSTIQN